jgi:putative redox protein
MASNKIECTWKHDMVFEADVQGFKILMDADPSVGGQNLGPRPKPLLLVALAGCTGLDVISILRKMRSEPESFNIYVEGEQMEEHPKYYHTIHVVYELKGKEVELEKVQKAVALSKERYCGVNALLQFGAKITHEIRILD